MQRLSLPQIQVRAWLTSALVALLSCLLIMGVFSYTQYRNQVTTAQSAFESASDQAFRRLEAEISVNNLAAVPALQNLLSKELLLSDLKLTSQLPTSCTNNQCIQSSDGQFSAYRKITTRSGEFILYASQKFPTFISSVNLSSFWWVLLSISVLALAGILVQRFITQKYIVNPVSELVHKTLKSENLPDYYPEEIRKLSEDLATSIETRDQAIFAQLASGVIHDLRTQIYSIETALHLSSAIEAENPKRKERLELLFQAAQHNIPKMKSIIESTLDGIREIKINSSESDIVSTVKEAIQTVSPLAAKKQVSINLDLPESLNIRHDKTQLERVFSNLIRNAIEAFDNNSPAPTRTISVSLRDYSNLVYVDIEDSGPGLKINASDAFKFSKTTKRHGSGLGLFISRKIVAAHNGKIAYSNSDTLKGAKFSIELDKNSEGSV